MGISNTSVCLGVLFALCSYENGAGRTPGAANDLLTRVLCSRQCDPWGSQLRVLHGFLLVSKVRVLNETGFCVDSGVLLDVQDLGCVASACSVQENADFSVGNFQED